MRIPMKSKFVCHLSSVHKRHDTRVFQKEILSLKNVYNRVAFIVADGKGDSVSREGVEVYDVGKENSRFNRMFKSTGKVYRKALSLDADVYHFHDPELIRTGRKLMKQGKSVIYDIHEDIPKQIIGKHYLNKNLAPVIARLFMRFENRHAARFSALITATQKISERFYPLNSNTVVINNYPKKDELLAPSGTVKKKNQVCYVGAITRIRGIAQLIDSLPFTGVRLVLAGKFESKAFEMELREKSGWKQVDYLGEVNRSDLAKILAESKAGMVTFLPLPNHIDAQPNKIFEYMSARLPVIGSDFDLWKQIIANNNCGVCVNPDSPEEIADGITEIVQDDEKARRMGENGRRLVETVYNWETEVVKLLEIYENL
jgi:glycosyltransferase involved in cell wall biosynthesis